MGEVREGKTTKRRRRASDVRMGGPPIALVELRYTHGLFFLKACLKAVDFVLVSLCSNLRLATHSALADWADFLERWSLSVFSGSCKVQKVKQYVIVQYVIVRYAIQFRDLLTVPDVLSQRFTALDVDAVLANQHSIPADRKSRDGADS